MLLIVVGVVGLIVGFGFGFLIFNNKKKLLTRPQLREVLSKVLNRHNQTDKLILFLINLDDFHDTIEAFGYKIGNDIIKHTKDKIADFAKKNYATFYYVGFDEYVVWYCSKSIDKTKIINYANNLLEIIAEPVMYDNHNIHVTASIGIGIFPDHADNSDLLLRRVEIALVDAKKTGRNTYNFYRTALVDKAVDLTVIKTELLTALNNEDLQLLFQPQLDVKTGSLVGAEALIRWNHPTKGSISPEVFISIAEQTGLIFPIGAWIIKHACIQAKFLAEELGIDDLKIAINLSNGQFLQGDVVEVIAKAIYDTGIKPHNIEIELTESMFMVDPEKSLLMLSVLISMGVTIAIDDFGMGYSSFNRLRQLKWHYLKIDRSFIQSLDSDQENYAIVCAIITMAKSLNMKVIAEGVETEQELAVLKKINCDNVQGFYTSKPLSISEFIIFARNRRIKS